MGNVWAVMLVAGTLVPVLGLVATGVWVARLARRIRALDGTADPPGRRVLQHLGIALGAQVAATILGWIPPLGLVARTGVASMVAMLVLPYRLHIRLRVLETGTLVPPGTGPADADRAAPASPGVDRPWGPAALFTLTGLLLPWAVGVGVKVYLDAHGRPTLPYSDFLSFSLTPVLLGLSLMTWAFPFLVLAALQLLMPAAGWPGGAGPGAGPGLPAWLAFGTGVVVGIPVFAGVFWQFDAIYLITPMGALLVGPMAVAYGLGILIVRRSAPRGAPRPAR